MTRLQRLVSLLLVVSILLTQSLVGYAQSVTVTNTVDVNGSTDSSGNTLDAANTPPTTEDFEPSLITYTATLTDTAIVNAANVEQNSATANTEVSGYTPGEFGVNEAGAATYRIPLVLPGGTGGMTPQLALIYDSRGGNTISAWGWSLSGLSAINRCPTTLAQHGFIDGVDFDGNDQFCLDGQLLVAVQGVYGADQTIYRTENESFGRIVSYGRTGNGPASFKVWTKTGLSMEYGLTDNSRLDAQGRADVLFWSVGRIQDTKGNYIAFDYAKNVASGELNPLRIRYTGNSAQNLLPYATVEFVYENRPDGRIQYMAGSAIYLTKRLQAVRSFVDGALVRELRFGYEASLTTGRSRLVNLTECSGTGQCLQPTRFAWSATSTTELDFTGAGSGSWQGHAGGPSNNAIGDFNGDGRTDLAGYTGINGLWHVCLSTGTNFSCSFWAGHAGGVGNNVTADFNGDGRTDLAGYTGVNGLWHVCLSTGANFTCSFWTGHGGGAGNNVLSDFNGDSLVDMAAYTGINGLWHVCLSTGSNFTCTMQYDLHGRKLSLRDPDTGLTQYRYNALDELVWQKDAKNQELTLVYDSLGRLIERRQPEGSSRWVYDKAVKGIGKLAEVSGPGAYKESYSYDNLGRPVQSTYTIDGQNFVMRTTYNQFSRIARLTYPTGFDVRHVYNTYGYLSEVRNAATNVPFWQANRMNARGQVEVESLRNGLRTNRTFDPQTGDLQSIKTGPTTDPTRVQNLTYAFDRLGNLTSRTDNRQQLTEVFKYDTLNRLTSVQVNTRAAQTTQYDVLGNITFKSDVGVYLYGENGAGPHAVTSIAGGVSASFGYDANGNRVRSNAGTIAYTSFNLPSNINHNNRSVAFAYGPDYTRYKETIQVSGVTTTTLMVGSLYERLTVGSRTTHKHYIAGSNGIVAIYYQQTGTPATYTHYLHRDRLGSIDTITDAVGNVVERLSYDAWGKRRTADWQNINAAITSVVRRGYTGHEHLDEVGLIHMNGRVYDPTIGRFLSADPFIQAPELSQSLNRYSYLMNNPLAGTDPSGFNWFSDLWNDIKDFFQENWKPILTAVVTYGVAWWASGVVGNVAWGSAIGNFAGNVTGVLINGGSTPQALQAGLRGAIKGYLQPYNVPSLYSSFTDTLQLLSTNFMEGVENIAKYAGGAYMNAQIVDKAIRPLAEGLDLSVDEFNFMLMGLSWAANEITAYPNGRLSSDWKEPETGAIGLTGINGVGNRKAVGAFFDVADLLLSYQGLLTGTAWQYASAANFDYNRIVRGHSAGALDGVNLVRRGLVGAAQVYALPFGAVAPAGVKVTLGEGDPIHLFRAGLLLNPDAHMESVPFGKHKRTCYRLADGVC